MLNKIIVEYIDKNVRNAFEIRMEEREKYRSVIEEEIRILSLKKLEDPEIYISLFNKAWNRLKPWKYKTLEEAEKNL